MKFFLSVIFMLAAVPLWANGNVALDELVERIAPGNSGRFLFSVDSAGCQGGAARFFEISSADGRASGAEIAIRANDNSSLAAGLNHYLKYYTGNHLSWNNMTAILPDTLPRPAEPVVMTNMLPFTYYLNYCTHSYSMAFWNWERWEREIDWMALHGVNIPLALTGADVVWRNTLRRLGYGDDEIAGFIAGPAFQAWWLMNNLEGWGGPNSPQWYDGRQRLQQQIIARMRQLDIEPVLPGYSGMVPHDARTRLGLDVSDPGRWCAYTRPAFLQPADPRFNEIADIYYEELTRLYGPAKFYAMDPFHEGGNTEGVDLEAAAANITAAMKRCVPDAVWVVQAWQGNPRRQLQQGAEPGEMLILDLWSESHPHWGDPEGPRADSAGYVNNHDWIFCMLLNFGGNVGLHGKMQSLPRSFDRAMESGSPSLKGVGLTMEGIENNPVMYELMCELPWRPAATDPGRWLDDYVTMRYGGVDTPDSTLHRAWRSLAATIYNCPAASRQQGTSESIFCARPAIGVRGASSWVNDSRYYDRGEVIAAADLFARGYDNIDSRQRNANLNYDYIDIQRQANAERGRLVYDSICAAFAAADRREVNRLAARFMALIERQDSLLAAEPSLRLDTWLDMARSVAPTEADRSAMVDQALRQVTTWGGREASENGGLHDYAHKEWNGLLKDYYALRWSRWFEALDNALARSSSEIEPIDWYEFESALIEEIKK